MNFRETHDPRHPGAFPIADPQTAAGLEAAELHKKWTAAAARIATMEDEHDAAQAAVRSLTAELQQALHDAAREGKNSTKTTTDLATKLKAAEEKAAAPWTPKLRGASAAARDARTEYARFVNEQFEALHGEFAEEAEQTRERIAAATEALAAAFAAYRDVAARVSDLASFASQIDGKDIAAVPMRAPGKRRSFHSVTETIADPTTPMLERLEADPDGSLPLPLVAKHAMAWRRRKLTGAQPEPSAPTAL